ncbi:MAG: hypothetical protein II225_00235, partial [Ruminococcus sp.]|nr:hypothetical protein [Ruminococcus sp.]
MARHIRLYLRLAPLQYLRYLVGYLHISKLIHIFAVSKDFFIITLIVIVPPKVQACILGGFFILRP